MKKIHLTIICLFYMISLCAQEKAVHPNIGLKWSPLGLILGNIGLQGEYNFGKNSLTAKIGIPLSTPLHMRFNHQDATFSMKTTSFLAGYRTYLSKKHLAGFYFEPFVKYVHQTSEGGGRATLNNRDELMNFTNEYNAIGLGAQLGVQFLVKKKFIIDFFFFGPEINSARNNFKAVEISSYQPWTSAEANEAEQEVRAFINKLPVVRNKVRVSVDESNKTVMADFTGALPGYRFGFSIGYAF